MQSSLIAPLNKKRYAAAAATIDNTVYVFGGAVGSNRHKDGEEYDRRTDKWTLLDQHMSVARCDLAAATVGNAVYLLGGWSDSFFTDVVECYDCVTKKFTSRKPLPSARRDLAAVGVRVSSATLARLTSSSK